MERLGYFLWEGGTFVAIIVFGAGLLVLRRKASGRPVFTYQDHQLFFGHAELKPRFYTNFGIAVFLCYLAGALEYFILARFGASILAAAQLITFLGIVKKSLC